MPKYLEIAACEKRSIEWDAIRDIPDPENGVEEYDMRNLPMKGVSDNTYDGVYSEHFIEHLHKQEAEAFFVEMLRILKPQGTIRTIWPSRDFVDKLLSDSELTAEEEFFCDSYHSEFIEPYDDGKYLGHCPGEYRDATKRERCARALLWQCGEHHYLWGIDELISKLQELGFVNVMAHEYQHSRLADFTNIADPDEDRKCHSAVVEAQKP